ncbi:class I SAM-dependent methyltransferase [Streptomyces pathocidini]|uniref:Class I SAM-dependent methyltransferase n=1 Tax=Streptomyces pathocidini TaxID=1650571 RepID=A0ABW7UL82_9ACTN|nr:class I SAM-dependent methyltransferase [Streptomyces pathocidini]
MPTAPEEKKRPESSYGAGLLNHQLPLEHRRLQALEAFGDPATRAAITARGLRSGWRCLELGGGAGGIAEWLASACAPGEVVVTDIDTSLLRRDIPNLTVLRHDVVHESFPEGSFDLVHTRALLEHLPSREEVLGRMASWVAPGGWLCVDGVITLDSAIGERRNGHDRCLRALVELAATKMGADLHWAQALPRLFAEAGLEDIGLDATPGQVGVGGNCNAFWRISIEHIEPALLELGMLEPRDWPESMELLDSGKFTDVPFLMLSVWGRRPR